MDPLMMAMLGLPARVERLERLAGEQRLLLSMLLNRSGLDENGVARAFELAEQSWKEIVARAAEKSSSEFLATPEGQQAHLEMRQDLQRRQGEIWRDECREEGRILPDPRAAKLTE